MNAIFGDLTTDGLEEAQDRLGGFQPLDSNAYDTKIKAMYAGQADSGARSVTVIADCDGRELRETVYITNKKGENFFLNKNDQTKKVPLPGFTLIDHICLITTGKPLAEQTTEEKVVKVYDRDAGGEVPTSVPMLVDCIGQDITLGVLRQLENKSKKVDGKYVDTAETREINLIDKVFDTKTKMTVVEAQNKAKEPEFYEAWLDKNKGEIRDRRTIKDGEGGDAGNSGRPASKPAAASGGGERKSLFDKS